MTYYHFIAYTLFLVSFCDLFFGIILLRHNPSRNPIHYHVSCVSFIFSAWSLLSGIVYLRYTMGLEFDFFYRAGWIGWLAVPFFAEIVYHVRERKREYIHHLAKVLLVFWVIALVLALFTDLAEMSPYSLIPFVNNGGPLEIPYRIVGGIMVLGLTFELYLAKRESSGIRRLQLNYFFTGTIFTAGTAAILAGFLQAIDGAPIDPALGSYLSLPWIATTYYAITRYRLFDIQYVLSNAVTLLFFAVILAVVHIGLFSIFEPTVGATPAILISFVSIIFLLYFTPLRKATRNIIEKIILKGRYEYQHVLKDFARALVNILDLDQLLRRMVTTTSKTFACEASIFLPDSAGKFSFRCGTTVPTQETSLSSVCIKVMAWDKKALLLEEISGSEETEQSGVLYQELKRLGAAVALPLLYQEALRGVLILGERQDGQPYLKNDLELLEALASQLAIALENARLYDEAVTDEVSGLHDMRYFRRRFLQEYDQAKEKMRPLSLLLIDIDHFRTINDRYGRLAGDRLIRDTATIIRGVVRPDDVAARFGGEEFIVLLPDTDRETAHLVGERIRASVEKIVFEKELAFTVSLGLASACFSPASVSSADELMKAADEALRKAKRAGKNRIALSV